MNQITALYMDSEIAYAEDAPFQDMLVEILDQIENSFYNSVKSEIELSIVNPDGITIKSKLAYFL